MSKTDVNRLVQQAFHIPAQEAARLVSNAIRDGVLTEVEYKGIWKKGGRKPKFYIVLRTLAEIEERR